MAERDDNILPKPVGGVDPQQMDDQHGDRLVGVDYGYHDGGQDDHHDDHGNHAGHGYGDNQELYVHEFKDHYGSKFGMWLFLFTEVLLFGGLLFLYYGYRIEYPQQFHDGAMELSVVLGTVNTIVLLTSSLTMVLAIVALQRQSKKVSIFYMIVTIACAFTFLINKYFEWSAKIHHGIYPGSDEMPAHLQAEGIDTFFGLYYLMTGLHTFHVIVGVILLSALTAMIARGTLHHKYYTHLENGGLYWHLVDLIWIFLFPLFYLLH
jgi:cytochrome c oxidase subunit 3